MQLFSTRVNLIEMLKRFCTFLQILEEKVEYWMEKYDRDVEQKQHELDVLKVCISD